MDSRRPRQALEGCLRRQSAEPGSGSDRSLPAPRARSQGSSRDVSSRPGRAEARGKGAPGRAFERETGRARDRVRDRRDRERPGCLEPARSHASQERSRRVLRGKRHHGPRPQPARRSTGAREARETRRRCGGLPSVEELRSRKSRSAGSSHFIRAWSRFRARAGSKASSPSSRRRKCR